MPRAVKASIPEGVRHVRSGPRKRMPFLTWPLLVRRGPMSRAFGRLSMLRKGGGRIVGVVRFAIVGGLVVLKFDGLEW